MLNKITRILIAVLIFSYSPNISAQNIPFEEGRSKHESPGGFSFIPFAYYSPETAYAAGFISLYYFKEVGKKAIKRPSHIRTTTAFTQNNQSIIEIFPEFYFKKTKFVLNGNLGFRFYPAKYYGIGNNTLLSNEEDYTPQISDLGINVQKKIHENINVGARYEFTATRIIEIEQNKKLDLEDIAGKSGSTISGLGGIVTFDTRESIFAPLGGTFCEFSMMNFGKSVGSEYDFTKIYLDAREYFEVHDNQVLALQQYVRIVTGNPTFTGLSMLGGNKLLRGYYLGRYREKNMLVVQAEYRFPLFTRFGMVVFGGLGEVSDTLEDFKLENLKDSFGIGIRYRLDKRYRISARLDFAFGRDQQGVYGAIREAF